MTESSDVVIIGGAWPAALPPTTWPWPGEGHIVERRGISSQASGFSAGGLNPLEGSCIPGPLSALAMASFKLHKELEGEQKRNRHRLPKPHRFSDQGGFRRGRACRIAGIDRPFRGPREEGFCREQLNREEILALNPAFAQADWRRSVVRQRYLEQPDVNQALAEGAQKLGATVRAGAARGVRLDNGAGVVGHSGRREIPCGQLVLAAGPWSREAEPWLDISCRWTR